MARNVPDPEPDLSEAVNSLGALKFLAIFGAVKGWNMIWTEEMLTGFPVSTIEALTLIHVVPKLKSVLERHLNPRFGGEQEALINVVTLLLAEGCDLLTYLAGEDELAAHQRGDVHSACCDQMIHKAA